MSLTEDTAIGPYRIVRKIGEGGMGAVYLANHALLGRPAAIKVLLPALSSEREIVDRFFNEARATTAVKDAGIVQVFDFGFHTDNSAYIVMELLEGESLDARIHRGTLSVADALRITRQVAGSLAAAHARGIVHRDLKPDNIFIVRDPEAQGGERPKILDFGIAKLTADGPDKSRTRTGMLMGTPIYMSPEQCRGSGAIDHRSDIYSLGCVLYHMLTGHPPFDFEGMGDIIAAHLREAPRPPSTLAVGVPRTVDELVLRALAKAPEARFQSMTELQAACEAQLARITGAGAQTIALSPPPAVDLDPRRGQPTTLGGAAAQASAEPRRRRAGASIAVAGVVAIAVGVFAMVKMRAADTNDDLAPASAPTALATPDARVESKAALPADAALPTASIDATSPDAAPPPDAAPRPPPPRPTHRTSTGHPPVTTHGTPPGEDPYGIR